MIPVNERNAADEDVSMAVNPITNISSERFIPIYAKNSVIVANASVGKMPDTNSKIFDSRIWRLARIALTQIRKGKTEIVR